MNPLDLYDPSQIVNPITRRAALPKVPTFDEMEPEQPEEPSSVMGQIGGSLLDGLSTVGYALDVLGRPIRRGLAGEDPTGNAEVSGRDVLERWGLAGENQPGLFNSVGDFAGDVAGFGLEVATDPFTWVGPGITKHGVKALSGARAAKTAAAASASTASKAGLAARHLQGQIDDAVELLGKETDLVKKAGLEDALKGLRTQHAAETAAEIAAKELNARDVAEFAKHDYGDTWAEQVRRGQRALLSIGNPLSGGEGQSWAHIGTGETAAKFAEPFTQAARAIKMSGPGTAFMGLFDPLAGGASKYEAQEIARNQAAKQEAYGAEAADETLRNIQREQDVLRPLLTPGGQTPPAPPAAPSMAPLPRTDNPFSDLPLASTKPQRSRYDIPEGDELLPMTLGGRGVLRSELDDALAAIPESPASPSAGLSFGRSGDAGEAIGDVDVVSRGIEGLRPVVGGMTKEQFLQAAIDNRGARGLLSPQDILMDPDVDRLLAGIPQGSRVLATGNKAIALETPGGEVLRIGRGQKRPSLPEVLQPSSVENIGGWTVERLPKAEVPRFRASDSGEAFMESLMEEGRSPTGRFTTPDVHRGNIGKVGDEWKVIDPSAIIPKGDVPLASLKPQGPAGSPSVGEQLAKLIEVDTKIMDPIVNSGKGPEVGITNNEFFRTLSALYDEKLRIKNEFGLSAGDLQEWKDAVSHLEARTAQAASALRKMGKTAAAEAYTSTMPAMVDLAENDLFAATKQIAGPARPEIIKMPKPKKPDIAQQAEEAMKAGTQYAEAPANWRNELTKLVKAGNMTYQEGEDVMNAMGSVAAGMAAAWGRGSRDAFLKSIELKASPTSGIYRITENGVTKDIKETQAWLDDAGKFFGFTKGTKDVMPPGATRKGNVWADKSGVVHNPIGDNRYKHVAGTAESIVRAKTGPGELKQLIKLYKEADVTTFVHEFIHAVTPHIPQNDLKILSDFVARETGVPISGAWTDVHHEALARQWEYYHATGIAPTTALQAVFARLKEAFRKALEVLGAVDPEVKNVFDSWYKAGEGAAIHGEPQALPAKMPRKAASAKQVKAKPITPIASIPSDQLIKLPLGELASRWGQGDMDAIGVIGKLLGATVDGIDIPFAATARKLGGDFESSLEFVNEAVAKMFVAISEGRMKPLDEKIEGLIVESANNLRKTELSRGGGAAKGTLKGDAGDIAIENVEKRAGRANQPNATVEDSVDRVAEMRRIAQAIPEGSNARRIMEEYDAIKARLATADEATSFAFQTQMESLLKELQKDIEFREIAEGISGRKVIKGPRKPTPTEHLPDMPMEGEKPTKKPGMSPLAGRLKNKPPAAKPAEIPVSPIDEDIPAHRTPVDEDLTAATPAGQRVQARVSEGYSGGNLPSTDLHRAIMDNPQALDATIEQAKQLDPEAAQQWAKDANQSVVAVDSGPAVAFKVADDGLPELLINPAAMKQAVESVADDAQAAVAGPQVREWRMPSQAPARAPADIEASFVKPAEPPAVDVAPRDVVDVKPAVKETSAVPDMAEGSSYFAKRTAETAAKKAEAATPPAPPQTPVKPPAPPAEPPKGPPNPPLADGLPPPEVPDDIPVDMQRVMNKLVQGVSLGARELDLIKKDPQAFIDYAADIRRSYDIEHQDLMELGVLSPSKSKKLRSNIKFQHQQSRVAKQHEIEELTAVGKKAKSTKSFFDPFWETITGQIGKYTGRLVAPLRDYVTQAQKEQFQGFLGGVEGVNDFIRQWGGKPADESMINALRTAKEDFPHFRTDEHLQKTAQTISKIKLPPGTQRFFDVDSATALFAYKQRIARVKGAAEATQKLFSEFAEKEAGPGTVKLSDAYNALMGGKLDDENMVFGRMLRDNAQALGAKGFKSIDDMKNLHVPSEIVAQAKRFMRFNATPEYLQKPLAALDWYTDVMKTALTVMWPANITRNVTAGQYMNFLTAGIVPTMKAWKPALDVALGRPLEGKWKKYYREMEMYGVLDPRSGFRGYGINRIDDVREIGEHRPTLGGLYTKNKEDTALQVPILREWSAGGQTAAGTAEVFNRATNYIAMREQGKTALEALHSTHRAQFDYRSGLSIFEREWMRRLAPFYSFARFNAVFTVNELLNHPGGGLAQSIRAANVAREDSDIPPWMGGKFVTPVGVSEDGSTARYLSGLGLPFEEAFERVGSDPKRTLQQHAAMLHPLIKGPLEYMTGTQLYSGRDLSSLQQYPTGIPEIDQTIFNSPASRAITSVRTAADERKGIGEKALNLLTGAKVTDVDIESAREAKRRDDIRKALEASGKSQERKIITKRKDIPLTPEEEALFKEYQKPSKKKPKA